MRNELNFTRWGVTALGLVVAAYAFLQGVRVQEARPDLALVSCVVAVFMLAVTVVCNLMMRGGR